MLTRRVGRRLVLIAGALLVARGAQAQESVADSLALTHVRARLVAAFRSNSADSLAPVAAENIVFVSTPMIVGRDAFVAFFKKPFDEARASHQGNPFVLYPALVRLDGEWAFERGQFGPDNAPPVGTYTWLYRRSKAGVWELAYWGHGGAAHRAAN